MDEKMSMLAIRDVIGMLGRKEVLKRSWVKVG